VEDESCSQTLVELSTLASVAVMLLKLTVLVVN